MKNISYILFCFVINFFATKTKQFFTINPHSVRFKFTKTQEFIVESRNLIDKLNALDQTVENFFENQEENREKKKRTFSPLRCLLENFLLSSGK